MGATHSIVCDDCKESYWCGERYKLYSSDTTFAFLDKHTNHAIRFIHNFEYDKSYSYSDYTEQPK